MASRFGTFQGRFTIFEFTLICGMIDCNESVHLASMQFKSMLHGIYMSLLRERKKYIIKGPKNDGI